MSVPRPLPDPLARHPGEKARRPPAARPEGGQLAGPNQVTERGRGMSIGVIKLQKDGEGCL